MKCTTCGYPIWNLRERVCPECGSHWLPSDFDFVPNSVRFCCPHCLQDYYGTDQRGHLVPRAFSCLGCGHDIDLDQMVLLPTQGVTEEQTRGDRMPWLERGPDAPSFLTRWFKTILRSMGAPGRLMRMTPPQSSAGAALGFAFLTLFVQMAVSLGAFVFLPMAIAGARAGFVLLLPFAVAIVTAVSLLVLWGVIAHGLLSITGPKAHGLSRTFHAIGYSSGVNIVSAVPCLGFYIIPLAWVWWIIAATVMTREAQRVSGTRAFIAVAAVPTLLVAALVAWVTFVIVPSMQTAIATARTQATKAAGSIQYIHALDINTKLIARATGGQWPIHVAELVARDQVVPAWFLTDGSAIAPHLAVAGVPLERLTTESGATLETSISAVAAAVPPDVVAYRLGDYVFTYPGLPAPDGSPDFWTFIAEVRVSSNPGLPQNQPAAAPDWIVGLSDGTIREIAAPDTAVELTAQNQVRAAAGLQPLPAPTDVQGWHRGATSAPEAPAAPTSNPP